MTDRPVGHGAPDGLDPVIARKTWRSLEPVHGMIYFAPESSDRYAAAGLQGRRMGYFASRSAAMGPVPAEAVIATFFNFNPVLIRRTIPAAWDLAPPARILAARLEAADLALRRAFGETVDSPELVEVAGLARRAAEAACDRPEGRALFAAHASLPWPDEPHLVLWHAQTLLREFRGDAHVAALLYDGLSGIESLVSHAASGDVPADILRFSRGWPEDDWAAAVDAMRSRRLVSGDGSGEPTFTDDGRAQRQRIEDRTDALSVPAYEPLGEDGCTRLRALGRTFSKAVVAAGLIIVDEDTWSDE